MREDDAPPTRKTPHSFDNRPASREDTAVPRPTASPSDSAEPLNLRAERLQKRLRQIERLASSPTPLTEEEEHALSNRARLERELAVLQQSGQPEQPPTPASCSEPKLLADAKALAADAAEEESGALYSLYGAGAPADAPAAPLSFRPASATDLLTALHWLPMAYRGSRWTGSVRLSVSRSFYVTVVVDGEGARVQYSQQGGGSGAEPFLVVEGSRDALLAMLEGAATPCAADHAPPRAAPHAPTWTPPHPLLPPRAGA